MHLPAAQLLLGVLGWLAANHHSAGKGRQPPASRAEAAAKPAAPAPSPPPPGVSDQSSLVYSAPPSYPMYGCVAPPIYT